MKPSTSYRERERESASAEDDLKLTWALGRSVYASAGGPPPQPQQPSQHHHHHPLPQHHHHVHHPAPHQHQPHTTHHHHHPRPAAPPQSPQQQHNPPSFGGAGFKHEGGAFGGGEFPPFGAPPYGYPQYASAEQARLEQTRMELAQQVQQQAASVAAQNALPPRVPLADRDVFMLCVPPFPSLLQSQLTDARTSSLPSQDLPTYYDPSSDSDGSSSDTSSCSNPPPPLTTNRGHKLSRTAIHVRRGRLGSYPHTDSGFTASKRRKTALEGYLPLSAGFDVAPNLHLLHPKAAGPALAILPPPPQSPLDLLLSTAVQYTLGAKNRTLDTLAMSATGLIEQEGPLVGALSRVCAGLRGEGYEWRWEGDEEVMRKREEEREVERKEEEEIERKRREKEREREERREEERVRREEEEEKRRVVEEEREAAEKEAARIKDEEEAAIAAAAAAEAAALEAATAKASAEAKEASVVEANAEAVAGPLPPADSDDPMHPVAPPLDADPTAIDTTSDLPPFPLDSLPALPLDSLPALPLDSIPALPLGALPALPPSPSHDPEADDDSSHEEPTRRRSGRVASRTDNPRHRSSSESSDVSDGAPVRLELSASRAAEEEMPEYAKRLVDPEVYVRSLFVSRESVEMPVTLQGGPAGSTATDLLSPNEQEVMVHDCLT